MRPLYIVNNQEKIFTPVGIAMIMVMMPKNEVELSLEDAQKVSKLIDNLDDLDDVQNIYSNWTASDEVMAQLDEE